MYTKIDWQVKSIRRIELTSDSRTTFVHAEAETGTEEVWWCPSDSANHYHLRNLFSSDIYIPSNIVCGKKDIVI